MIREAFTLAAAAWIVIGMQAGEAARADDHSQIEQNRRRIAAMSESDRIRLTRNLKLFREASSEQQAALARIHKETEQQPALSKLVDVYNRWLSRLPPFDRERLKRIDDPVERAKLVQSLIEDQKKSRAERDRREDVALFGVAGPPAARRLGVRGLETVILALEQGYLAAEIKRTPLPAGLVGRDRRLRVLEIAMEQSKRDRRSKSLQDNDPLADAIINALPDAQWQARLKENKKPRERRFAVGNSIAAAVREEWQNEVDAGSPSDEQIAEFVAKRMSNSPERALRMKTAEGRRMIALRFAADKNPTLKRVGHVVFWLQNGFREPRFLARGPGERTGERRFDERGMRPPGDPGRAAKQEQKQEQKSAPGQAKKPANRPSTDGF